MRAGFRTDLSTTPQRRVRPSSAVSQLREIVAKAPLNPKRLVTSGGIDAWYPYYAGFSSRFAGVVLSSLQLQPGARLLDPWNGSGTTTYVGQAQGYNCIGIDLNPFPALVASAKLARFDDVHAAQSLLKRMLAHFDRDPIKKWDQGDGLGDWLVPKSAAYLRMLMHAFLTEPNGRFASPTDTVPTPVSAFFVLALLSTYRQLGQRRKSNPTWARPEEQQKLARRDIKSAFLRTVRDLWASIGPVPLSGRNTVELSIGDVRNLNVESGSIDVLLCSPPYCTRIDYAVNNGFELAALGLTPESDSFRELRRQLMGTTMIRNRVAQKAPGSWAGDVVRLLERVSEHSSYSSANYYFKNLWQYFDDSHRALGQLERVLKPGGIGFFVLQTSFYKEIEIDLPCLYVRMAETFGLRAEVLSNIPVESFFAKINKAAIKHLPTRQYREAVVLIEK